MGVDKIPGTQVFTQRDVRRTPAATATATSVGLTDLNYVLLSTDADTTRDRVLTPGEGINFADTGPKGTLTINGENATDGGNKGIASFNPDDFSVTAGAVSVEDNILKTIDGDTGTATGSLHNIDILGGDGISTAGASNDITITADVTTAIIPPIGSVMAWLKTFTNTPSLLNGWVECNGQVLSDGNSVYNGQTIPDLNGDNQFLRGNSTSGGTGGSETMAHIHTGGTAASGSTQSLDENLANASANTTNHTHSFTTNAASNDENRPPFFDVVWIMRIK